MGTATLMDNPSHLTKILALSVLATAAQIGVARATFPASQGASIEEKDQQDCKIARQGIRLLMDGDPDAAIEVFRQIQKDDPESPLGYLFEADATWWKIYLTTGDLVDPDVFDVARSSKSPYDAHFEEMTNIAIRKSAARVQAHQDEAHNVLYEGLSYGLRGRFYGLRDNDLPTARAGKKMRALFLRAVELDPGLTDAY